MRKIFSKIFITLVSLVGAILLFSILFVLFLQTSLGQKKVKSIFIEAASKKKINLKIEKLKGTMPFTFIFENLEINTNQNNLKIEKLSTSISLISLFKKELSLTNLKAQNIFIALKENTAANNNTSPFPSLPFGLKLKSFNLENIHFKTQNFSLLGNLAIKKDFKDIYLNISFQKKEFEKSFVKLLFNKKKENIAISLKTKASTKFFQELFNKNFDLPDRAISFKITSKTSSQNFADFIFSKDKVSSLPAKMQGDIEPFKFNLDFSIFSNLSLDIALLNLSSDFLKVEGKAFFDPNFVLKNSALSINCNFSNLKNFPVSGKILGKFSYAEKETNLSYTGNLEIKNHKISNIEGSLNAKNLNGKLLQSFDLYEEKLSLQTDFLLDKNLNLSNLLISSASFNASGNFKISKNYLVDGALKLHLDNLSFLDNFLFQKLNGFLDVEANFFSQDLLQMANLNFQLKDFHYNNFFGDTLSLNMTLKDIYKKPLFDLNLSLINARLHKIKIDTLALSAKDNIFDLALTGTFRDPLEIKSKGSWSFDNDLILKIQSMNGNILKSPFSLTKEASLIYGKTFSLKDFEVKMPSSLLQADLFLDKNLKNIAITAEHFPIDFLSFNPLEVNVSGFCSLKTSLVQKENKLEGNLSANLEELNLNSISEKEILKTKGLIEAKIENEKFLGVVDLFKENEKILNLNFDLPLQNSSFQIDQSKSLKSSFSMNLKIEDILDFFDLGNHQIEGDLKCSLQITESFTKPHIEGYCNLEKGSYENYYSGTSLKNINFALLGNGTNLVLKSFSANDEKNGKIEALGNLALNSLTNYSYNLDLTFSKMEFVATDLVTASFNGNLKVEGDKNGSLAKGTVEVSKADFSIPDKLPETMPELEIKFLNKTSTFKPVKKTYPLNFDINMSGDNIYVKGKGVDAKLKGSLLLKGSYSSLIPEGKLELINGSYLFSGRNFSLSEGTLIFTGKAGVIPRLLIKAELPQEGYMIYAILQGPINAPHLSFTSTPALPLSSIISIIVFGKDLSGISGLQALQLATTIAALSDTTSLLESTKRSLGIDRLTVVSKTGEKSEEQVSVEVGKYITRDLLISIQQGITEGTSNASVELNLGWGFILQLQTLQEEEQAKGTLKWSRNF